MSTEILISHAMVVVALSARMILKGRFRRRRRENRRIVEDSEWLLERTIKRVETSLRVHDWMHRDDVR